LFNHESPRRGFEFVTRKISAGVARIVAGESKELRLGNAREYVQAMWLMLQHPDPDDYVVATGEAHSVREWVDQSFRCDELDWTKYVVVDSELYCPAEVNMLLGDSKKACMQLGWANSVSFEHLVHEMVESDCRAAGVGDAVVNVALASA